MAALFDFFNDNILESNIYIVFEPIIFVLRLNSLYLWINIGYYNLSRQKSYIYNFLDNATKFENIFTIAKNLLL